MAISIQEAQRLGLIPKTEKRAAQREPYVPKLVKRLSPLCGQYGWQCGLDRVPCDDPQSPQNTGKTVARNNAVVVWSDGRTAQLGWIWDVKKWTDEQVIARLKELEDKDAKG